MAIALIDIKVNGKKIFIFFVPLFRCIGLPMKKVNSVFNVAIDNGKARDTGLAIVLILLLLELFVANRLFLKLAVPVLVVNMIVPQVFKPLAYLWFGLAHVMGTVVSKVLLFIVYVLLVLPVGIARRMMGKDPMRLMKWKKGTESVFSTRNHLYTASDIEKPY